MLTALLLAAVQTHAELPAQKPDAVLIWNETALRVIRADRTPPPLAARNLAMVHVAVYDAVNAVCRSHQPFLVDAGPRCCTAPDAAAAIAAHRVLLELYPCQAERLNAVLRDSLLDVDEGPAKGAGVELGQSVAEKVLAWREDDGHNRRSTYRPRNEPGAWQPTPPGYRPALLPQWPRVKCFAMRAGNQFRPPAPPALTSEGYAVSFQEVKVLGAVDSTVRTREQTAIAHFWADGEGTVTPPGHWNRIAQTVARSRGNTLAENARLFALLNVAVADAGIACWDCKYVYDLWRPIHAIRETDPRWTPLLETPPFPAYTSGHSTFSAAAATVLTCFFETDAIRFASTSESLPGVTRSYSSFWAAAEEAGQSRIYGGIHWQFDNREGLTCGRAVAEHVCRHFMLPRSTRPAAGPPDVRLLPPVIGDGLPAAARR